LIALLLTIFKLYLLTEQTPEEAKKLREEKKRMLLRKLSFRPTIDELKEKKV
jgi:phosphatase and actin regulator 3